MLLTLSILFIVAFVTGFLFEKINLPALLGYMIIGICFSPYAMEYLDLKDSIFTHLFLSFDTAVSTTPVRELALFIILFRAGLGLDRSGLKFHGGNAISMSFLPCLLEAATIACCSMFLFQLPLVESCIIAFVVAAVSPAVIVPQMLELQNKEIGTDKKIPTLVLAGSTIDDILAISGFGICLALLTVGENEGVRQLIIKIPFSVLAGIGIGYFLARPLVTALKKSALHPAFYVVALLAVAMGFKQLEESRIFFFSHLIAILTLGISIQSIDFDFSEVLAKWFSRVWAFAVILLFILIGAMVNPTTALDAGLYGILILLCGLTARSLGVLLSLTNSKLNMKEKLFCVIAYIPKATVQATIGGITVSLFLKGNIWLYNGLDTGELIVAMAALSILITAPLGSIGIKIFSKKLLKDSSSNSSDIS